MNSVFVLWHVHQVEVNDHDDEKLIGVYRTEDDAKAAIERLKFKSGFNETPEGFEISEYKLGVDHWTDGFIAV